MILANHFGQWTFTLDGKLLSVGGSQKVGDNTEHLFRGGIEVSPEIVPLFLETKLIPDTIGGINGIVQSREITRNSLTIKIEQVEYECGDDYAFMLTFGDTTIAFLADWEVRRIGSFLS